MSDLTQLVYFSRPFGFDDAMLNGILMSARRNNPRHAITGALICRPDVYMQLLEGPRPAVEGLYKAIQRDNRHLEVTLCFCHPAAERMFPNWAMRDDPARSWLWSPAEVNAGAIEKATPEEVLAVFARVAAEIEPGA